jgi:hypothetical protein
MRKIATIVILAACLPMSAVAEDVDLDAMRASVERFKDINVAIAEGYISPDNTCVSAAAEGLPAELGAMGMHFVHPALLQITATEPRVDGGSTYTDWSQPAILIYEPQADGSMELVAVENLVFEAAWMAAGSGDVPTLNGRTWDHMADDPATPGDEAHGFMPHYDQHVWLFRENPMGDLMPFNPNVTCEHAAS